MPKKQLPIKARKKRTKQASTSKVEGVQKLVAVETLPAVEVLTLPHNDGVDSRLDSRLQVGGSLSAPSYPIVPDADPVPSTANTGSQKAQGELTARFSQIVVRRMLSISKSIEEFTTFTLTGVAAFIALIISNAGGLREIVSEQGFKVGIVLFVASLLAGAVSKFLGAGVSAGAQTVHELESELTAMNGAIRTEEKAATPDQVLHGIAAAFPWPISTVIERSTLRGTFDLLADRSCIRLFCAQIFTHLLHWLLGVTAILILAFSMTGKS